MICVLGLWGDHRLHGAGATALSKYQRVKYCLPNQTMTMEMYLIVKSLDKLSLRMCNKKHQMY